MSSNRVAIDWHHELTDQLDWHWGIVRRRLNDLTDEEYLWEPVPGCWTVRDTGDGTFAMDRADPEPDPAPFTTIAWRLAHIVVDVLAVRASNHFGDGRFDPDGQRWPGTAAGALAILDQAYADWTAGVDSLGEDGLARPCGPAEGPFADAPMAALILHINREVIHHLAEVLCVRDLYRARAALLA